MAVLRPQDLETVRRRFEAELEEDVHITLYTQPVTGLYLPGRQCETCGPTQELLEELTALSPKVHLTVKDFYGQEKEARARGVDKIPCTIVHFDGRDNARYYGLPSGYEFALLLDDIVDASRRRVSLEEESRRKLARLKEEVHIQVFVTPT